MRGLKPILTWKLSRVQVEAGRGARVRGATSNLHEFTKLDVYPIVARADRDLDHAGIAKASRIAIAVTKWG